MHAATRLTALWKVEVATARKQALFDFKIFNKYYFKTAPSGWIHGSFVIVRLV